MANETNFPHRSSTTLLPKSDPFVRALDLQNRPVINAQFGGMYGWAGNVFEYVSAQPHVSQLGWCIVLSTPAAFSRLPGGTALHSLCKAWFENRSQSFEGLRDMTEVQFAQMEWTGHVLSIPSGATRSMGQVTHTGYDCIGEVFTKMFKVWQQWLVMDSEVLNAKIVILDNPGDMLIDEVSVSCIYFEPTHTMKDIAHAALVVGMMPRTSVPIEIKRNKSEEGAIRQITMEFTGLVEFDTLAVKQIARQMLKLLPLYNPDAIAAPPGFKQRSAAVTSSPSGTIERMIDQKAQVDGAAGQLYMG
ncbi:hypothetical protein [Pseudomonas phage IR-QUMS-PaBa1-GHS-2021]|uniref:hypothetical protein n=2 Tax=Pseudomonas aeruginosa TaxID=287 RepID=UPI002377471F|nr:hypothetical protein [Pseudomonas phage IR-QUMS-PaBa1-GHS-2021]